MYAPKTVNIDTAIWPLAEGVHSLERHEIVRLITADSRFKHEVRGKSYTFISGCIPLCTMYSTIAVNKARIPFTRDVDLNRNSIDH